MCSCRSTRSCRTWRKKRLRSWLVWQQAHLPEGPPDDLLVAGAQQMKERRIGIRDTRTAWLDQQNAVRGGFKQTAIAVLRAAQAFLGYLAFGHLRGEGNRFLAEETHSP